MKKNIILFVIVSVFISISISNTLALPEKWAYTTNANFISMRSSFIKIVQDKYGQRLSNLSEWAKKTLHSKIDDLIGKYENKKDLKNIKRLKRFAILYAVKDIISQKALISEMNEWSTTSINENSNDTSKKYLLWDGKISSSPKSGYIYSCSTRFGWGGAWKDGKWIEWDYWYPGEKTVSVSWDVSWDGNINISVNGVTRNILWNGLPSDHNTGVFPVSKYDDAYDYDRNPNNIIEYSLDYALPANPSIANTASCVGMWTIWVSMNGVALFNGLDATGKDAVAHEIQDLCEGHPERGWTYHYHNIWSCLDDSIEDNSNGSAKLVWYALDWFGIYGNEENWKNITNDDLDECHGHSHEINWDGEKKDIFHYHATPNYPYMVGCFKWIPIK